jgi:hypothetical protein
MKRLAIITTVISLVLLIIGLIDWATNYNWAQGDQNALFGNQSILLNDGMTVIIAAGFLLIGSAIMWLLAMRKGHSDQRGS